MSYLEEFLENIQGLPNDVKRNFTQLKELDNRSNNLFVKLGENSKKYFQHLQKEKKEKVERNEGFEENTELLHSIKKDQKKCLALATEKIQIALQTYQGVESYIKMLDKKIKNFDQELKEQGGLDNCISDDLNYMPQLQPTKKNHLKRHKADSYNQRHSGKKSKYESVYKKQRVGNFFDEDSLDYNKYGDKLDMSYNSNMAIPPTVGENISEGVVEGIQMEGGAQLVVDPNEPLYCFCRRVSYGKMVGCDNLHCQYQWFHFACVGLEEEPRDEWYCHQCRQAFEKKNKKK